MNPKFIPFNDQAQRLITDVTKRSEILAAAIARAIANVQPLPSSAVESPSSYFNMQVTPLVNAIASEWNENIVLNTKALVDYVRAFWMIRYNAAHPNTRPLYDGPYDFFCTIMNVKLYVSEKQYSFLCEQKETILALSTTASLMIDDAGKTNG